MTIVAPRDASDEAIPTSAGFLTIALVSAGVILAEVSVTRILSFRLFYHYVYMVISTALLGLSGGATFVALRGFRGAPIGRRVLVWSCIAFAILVPVVLFYLTLWTPSPNRSYGKIDGAPLLWFLPGAYLALTALFTAGGVAIAALFARFREQVARLYFWDLAAAATAAVVAVGLMKFATPIRCFLAAGLVVSIAAVRLASAEDRRRALATVAVLAVLFAVGPALFDPRFNLLGGGQEVARYRWTHQARVDFPAGNFVIDSDASTREAPSFPGRGGRRLPPISRFYEFAYDISGRTGLDVAIIGSGGGIDIYNALRREARSIVAIELNQAIYAWVIEDPNSVYHKEGVEPVLAEGRHSLSALGRQYDLIQLSLIDTYTASAQGAYALSENFLYTVEAFETYLDHLQPGGVLFISRWMFDPPRETLRLCTMADEALRRRGVPDPSRHMAVVGDRTRLRSDRRRGGFILSRDPLDDATLARIESRAARLGYGVLFLPGRPGSTAFHRFFEATDREAFFETYPYRVEPVTDDRPFFFQYFRLSSLGEAIRKGGVSLSQVVLFLTLGLALILSLAIVIIPSRRTVAGAQRDRWWVAAYFSALGLGFMLVEIPLIQRFTLYLGHPTHALVTILSSLLVSASVGSLLAGRIPLRRWSAGVVAAVALVVVVAIFAVPAVTRGTHQLEFGSRIALCLALIAPFGLALGLPLTLGVRRISAKGPGLVAWGWACNGAASVVAACLAMILLVYFGFAAALAAGAACYAVAALALGRMSGSGQEISA